MTKTKTKILSEALLLFNEHGLKNVSLRTISDALGMSVGNLQYHFKKREFIVEGLYFQMVKVIDEDMPKSLTVTNLTTCYALNQHIAHTFFEYRFFFLDFATIMRDHVRIKAHYQQLSEQREVQFLAIMQALVDTRLVREPILPNEYKTLYRQIEIVSNFWLSSTAIKVTALNDGLIADYAEIITRCLFPYLTDKGREAYLADDHLGLMNKITKD